MNTSIKAIIIDDEPRARSLLRGLLNEYCPEVEVMADCEDLPNGVKAIHRCKPDLVFLDIEMPGHSGLELLDFFEDDEVSFSIIFTTAYNQYAVKAFKLSAIDYLLKPIEPEELEDAIKRFKKHQKAQISILRDVLGGNTVNKIAVPVGNMVKFIALEDITYLKADNTYTEIMTADGAKLLVSRTLKNFEEALAGMQPFFRCHKSYIVNMAFVNGYVKSDGGYLVLKDGKEISISPERVQDFLKLSTYIKR
jgi:two-component system, LytTR family, response regulator